MNNPAQCCSLRHGAGAVTPERMNMNQEMTIRRSFKREKRGERKRRVEVEKEEDKNNNSIPQNLQHKEEKSPNTEELLWLQSL